MESSQSIPFALTILQKCQTLYEQAGLVTGWVEPSEEAPFHSLLVRYDKVGERESSVTMDLCFLPHLEEAASEGVYLLQTFVTITEKIFPIAAGEMLKIVAKINTQLPLGAYGFFEDTGLVYFKYNIIINESTGDDAAIKTIDQQSGLILHQIFLFIDAILDVAEGIKTAEEALQSAPLL
ncbi:MAG: hypothetical protein A4E53_02347 [Pelotomaculum sp. PtaB.Bin104]|nr:MAG: hypothetical protein A4E53_02347 [Pelotomaculum sp. PtaB.Bin104]